MKFAVLQFFSWPGQRVPLPTVYERAFQRIDVMEKTGYDAVWLAHEQFKYLQPGTGKLGSRPRRCENPRAYLLRYRAP